MFGMKTPWLTMKQDILRNEWGNMTTSKGVWERISLSGVVDLWQQANIAIDTTEGDWKVAKYFVVWSVSCESYIAFCYIFLLTTYYRLPHKYINFSYTHHTSTGTLFTVDPWGDRRPVAVDEFESWVGPCAMTSITCDFEASGCGWKDDDNYPLQWIRTVAEEGSQSSGYDHTSRTQFGK